jgi:Domain of unknown function (DUF4326)
MSVVHCKREAYDVYIGRGRDPRTGEPGRWGNPFRIGRDGSRAEVIERYGEWLGNELERGRIHLRDLAELDGKLLGCWCAPQPCHGEVLIAAAKWAHEHLAERQSQSNQGWCVGCSPDGGPDSLPCCGCGIPRQWL